ncbi:MazG nucleotide pyrophosphohydrolase domain-containing protein [Brachybacterium sp. DNPG3]
MTASDRPVDPADPAAPAAPAASAESAGSAGLDEPASDGAPRGAALLRAVEVMEALRAPDGDAWTRQQTHSSLARYLLEETHEVLEVIDDPAAHGPSALADELGDLLFQILFHARIGQEEDPAWDVDDVARSFVAKMERRNPHVFGADRSAALEDREDVEQIVAQWHAVKAAEKAARRAAAGVGSVDPAPADEPAPADDPDAPDAAAEWAEGIPARLPALQTAAKIVHRARSAGRLEELRALADDVEGAPDPEDADLGRALLDLVISAEARDTDPETALRALLARMTGSR